MEIARDGWRQIVLAHVLLTRLPLPPLPEAAFARGARAVWAYPVVGLVVGGAGAAAGQMALMAGLPGLAAATLAVAAMMLITGAMHEDGLADLCDGFWGGFEPARRLEIMRDSQIGTYGVLALGIVGLLRVSVLAVLVEQALAAILVAAIASRALMPLGMYFLPAARADGLSRSVGKPRAAPVACGYGLGLAAAVWGFGAAGMAATLIATGLAAGMLGLAKVKIGGQTGDVLGAVQQLGEAAILLALLALIRHPHPV